MKKPSLYLLIVPPVLFAAVGLSHAGTFTADFNDGLLPANMTAYGTAAVQPSGGFTNSGYLQLTTAASGGDAAVLINDLDSGTPVVSFTAQFKLWLGTPFYNIADGFSFNFAPDLPAGTYPQNPVGTTTIGAEEGAGTGYTIEFDTYDNGAPDSAPSIGIKVGPGLGDHSTYDGSELADTAVTLRKENFVDCVIQLNPNNTLTVTYDGAYVYSNLDLSSSGYTPVGASLFGFGARSGGITENAWLDNLTIITRTNGAPFVNSFLPQGSAAVTNSPFDIVLTDNTTQVNTNTIALKLNGITVSPTITQNGTGDTFIHYVKPTSLGFGSNYDVTLTYSDNASPTPQQFTWKYSFQTLPPPPPPPAPVTIFSDDFEHYNLDGLDKDLSGGPNEAPNGSGNPWFGPVPPNLRVVNAEGGVTPHSGTNMIRGLATGFDFDQDWYNIAYRLRGGQPIFGNCVLDWWFYDPAGPGGTGYRDYIALGFYNTAPVDTDYPGAGSLNSSTQIQRLSVGGAGQVGAGFDGTKYQCRNVSASGYSGGWNNTTTPRSIGWHHGRIVVGPPTNNLPMINWFVDDMDNPTFTQQCGTSFGFNVIEINGANNSIVGYYDDITFSLSRPPKPTVSRSGNTLTFSWPAGFTLQSAPEATGPYIDLSTTYTGYTYDVTSGPRQFFRLRN
jgi:Bacterial lectin